MSGNYFYDKLPGARLKIGPHGKLMETLGAYMLAPGARLEVGPHGKLMETLGNTGGACCDGCAKNGGGCGSKAAPLGAVSKATPQIMELLPSAATATPPSAATAGGLPSWALPVAAAGVGIVAVVWFLKRRKRR